MIGPNKYTRSDKKKTKQKTKKDYSRVSETCVSQPDYKGVTLPISCWKYHPYQNNPHASWTCFVFDGSVQDQEFGIFYKREQFTYRYFRG